MRRLRCPAAWYRESLILPGPGQPTDSPLETQGPVPSHPLRGGSRCPGTRPETGQCGVTATGCASGLWIPQLLSSRAGARAEFAQPLGTFLNKGSWHLQDSICFCCCRGRVASQGAQEPETEKQLRKSLGQPSRPRCLGPLARQRHRSTQAHSRAHTPHPAGRALPGAACLHPKGSLSEGE